MELQGQALHSDTRTGRFLRIMDENVSPGSLYQQMENLNACFT